MKKILLLVLPMFFYWQFSFAQTGQTLHFDGLNDYVNIGTLLTANSSYTKEAWINPSASNGFRNIISSLNNPFWINGNRLQAGNGGSYSLVVDPNNITLNVWTHVAVTYHAPTATMRLYRNGALIATRTGANAYTSQPEVIGAQGTGSTYVGNIDEVRVWNRALSTAEIQEVASGCGMPANTTGLQAHYPFNQGTAGGNNVGTTSLTDVSGNNNHGT